MKSARPFRPTAALALLLTLSGCHAKETALGYTKIVAPFDGVVTRKLADVGDPAAPGKPIEMEDPDALRFDAGVPEALIGDIKIGDRNVKRIAPRHRQHA